MIRLRVPEKFTKVTILDERGVPVEVGVTEDGARTFSAKAQTYIVRASLEYEPIP